MKKSLLLTMFVLIALWLSTDFVQAEMRYSISQYGITWTFNGQYECGQFVTGDWWVVGPVTINSVSPAPSPGRNGSCVNPMPNRQGYDDRSYPGDLYSTADRISYPVTLNADQTLVSSVSRSSVSINYGNMQSQAVLTVVSSPQPSGTFRPAYCGTYKRYFNTSQVNMSIIPNLPPPSSAMNASNLANYTDPPRIDHLGTWQIQFGCAEDNWNNGSVWGNEKAKCYGQNYSELVSEAALHAMLGIPEKTQLVNNLIQYGIDNYGVLKAGGKFAGDGGHYSGRKFPIVFAAILLNDADMLQVGVDYTSRKFGEYDQTYYNSSGKALWGRRVSDYCWWYQGCEGTSCGGSKDVADPDQLTDGCSTYRKIQTSRTWVGQALAALMIGGKSVWAHNAYFDYMDRWMDGDVGGGGQAHNDFVTDMWHIYRDDLPTGGGTISVTGVSVSPSTLTLDEGISQQLTETVSPTDATNKIVTWSSNNTAAAIVNSSGVVTAIAPGSATITATTLDGGFTDDCVVTVNSLGINVALNKSITVSDFDAASDQPGEYLVDGDISDDARWSASGFPQWAEIDLGADYSLNRIDVFPYQDRPYQYIIEGKADGGSYSTIVDRSSNTVSANNLYDNVSATVRYLKITVSGISGNTSSWVSLSELKAFTNDDPPPAGNEFYCSPSGSMSNNGTSPSTPWASLATVVSQKTFADGSTIYLMDGNHGSPVITESNTANVTVTKYAGANPVINNIDINGADYWTIKDIKISANGAAFPNQDVPLTHPVYPLEENSLVYILNSDNIIIENCDISSIDNSSVWTTTDDWNYTAWNGIMVSGGADVTIKDNHIKNVNFGNTAGGTANYIFRNNTVENFCGDGMQLGSNYAKIEYNTFMNCYKTNGNHDDIIQFYKGSGSSYGVEIRGNKLFDYTDPSQSFIGEAQGIGMFDGYQHNFIIENNLIVTDSWHGITVFGAMNCTINNNSVIEINNTGIGPCWIQIAAAKDGTPAAGNIVRNNLTTRLNNDSGIGTVENNDVISWSEYYTYFVDFANFDLHLAAGSPAIDAGTSSGAPSTDLDGVTRPQGSGYDIGCYEYVGGSVIAVTGVSVSPTTLSLNVGQSSDLTETVAPANATDKSVTWSSNNTSVATVDANGLVTAVSTGSATITVTTVDGALTANCAVTVTDEPQTTTTLNPVADAAVRDGSYENNNYGSSTILTVKNDIASYTRESFIKFDLSTISLPVSSAILRLYVSDDGVSTHTAKLVSDDSWTESGITYANKPSSGSTIASWDVTASGNQYIEIDITSAVISEAGDMLSIHITAGNNDYINYDSKEAENKPELVITSDSATIPVTGVSVSPTTLSLDKGQSSDLTETVLPVDASDPSVTWSSSDTSVATVDANGLVTAVDGGFAIIIVTTNDGSFTANCNVIVTVPVDGITVSPTSLSLNVGATSDLTETISPANADDQTVTWSSGDTSVATVDSNGLVTAISVGSAVITVTTTDGSYTANCNVEVNATSNNLAFNKPITVSAYQDDSFGYKPGVNLVDGDVTDDARWSASGFPQWAEIDLGADYDLTSIDLYPYQDRAYQYIVEAKTNTGSYMTIVDRSSNTVGADVLSNNVNATARYIKITVSGLSGSASTWVSLSELEVYGTLSSTVFVTGVSLSSSSLNLDEGQTADLDETVYPAEASDKTVSWSSSDPSVATVDASGLVTAVAEGSAVITVTTNDGSYMANCFVNATGAQQTTTLNPVADAFVRGGASENNNYGTDDELAIKNDYIDYVREAYLKFDLTGVSSSVSSAVLRLYLNDANPMTHYLKLVSDDSWTETGITYANAPSVGSTIASWDASTVGYIEVDITSTVASEAGGMLSLHIAASSSSDWSAYDSREGSNKPELVVTSGSSDTQAPSVPTGLAAGTVTGTTVDLSWAASTDNVAVTGYKVYTDGSDPVSIIGTSATISGLAQATQYSFTVSAIDAAGNESAQSASVQATTLDTEAPTVPTGLTAGTITETTVDLSWTASTDNVAVTGYNVYTDGSDPLTVTGTSTTISNLTAGTQYSFTVSAVDAAGNESAQSSTVQATTESVSLNDTLNPVADAFVRGGASENNNYGTDDELAVKNDYIDYVREAYLKFDLTGISSPASSAVLRLYLNDANPMTHYLKLVSDDSWTETGITYANAPSVGNTIASWDASTAGYIEVDITSTVASEAGGMLSLHIAASSSSDWSAYDSREGTHKPELIISGSGSDTQDPSVPTGLAAGTITSNSIALSWNASTDNVGVTGYKVYTDGSNPVTVAGTSTTMNGLAASTQYSFTVSAIDEAGNESVQSSSVSATTSAASGITSSTTWQSFGISTETGVFTATFDAVPNGNNIDAITGILNGSASAYGDVACIVRFNTSGQIDARNGGSYEATNAINYTSGVSYHFRVEINVPTHTYAVYVTPLGGSEQTVASNFAFRSEQSSVSQLTGWTLYALTGTHTVSNFTPAATDTEAPSVPTNLISSNIYATGFTLSWNASTDNVGVTGYEVFKDGVSVGTTISTSMAVTGLTASATYSMTVKARDAVPNWSASSSALNVSTSAGGAGDWPNADNTGPSGTLTSYSGSLRISTEGAVIENMDISGAIYVDANNVTIRNCKFYRLKINLASGDYDSRNHVLGVTGCVVEDCELKIAEVEGFTLRRCEMSSASADQIRINGGNVLIEDCYLHIDGPGIDGAHVDNIQSYPVPTHDVVIRHNTIYNSLSYTSCVNVQDATLDNNLFAGGGYVLYQSNMTVINNHFSDIFYDKCGRWGIGYPSNTPAEWSGNVWHETGEPIPSWSSAVVEVEKEVVALNKTGLNGDVKLYPNPLNGGGILHIQLSDYDASTANINIVDLVGRSVYSKLHTVEQSEMKISLDNLVKGIYIISINGNGINKQQKLIVE